MFISVSEPLIFFFKYKDSFLFIKKLDSFKLDMLFIRLRLCFDNISTSSCNSQHFKQTELTGLEFTSPIALLK
ncbi:hypothetical protein HanRHA438_Chr06g0277681 [Helianthus annuus]|nr:hypothetical protein HanRHA438_Chr06g0277681 [Helianthus annuus]